MDFSTISQDPLIRAVVQTGTLERQFRDALFPRLLFRGEAEQSLFPGNIGDSLSFTGVGLIPPSLAPLVPGVDPIPATWQAERWTAQTQLYGNAINTHMPSSIVAIANLFLRNAQQLGLSAGQTLNRLVRNVLYNAAESGNCTASGAQTGVSTLLVNRLNGLTRARRPDLSTGSPVAFDPVSSSNPLTVSITTTTGVVTRQITSFIPTTSGDEVGPGTITFTGGTVTVADRAPVLASDCSAVVRVGGGSSTDAIGSNDLLRLSDIRNILAQFRLNNVPEMPDGRFHAHLDPTSETQLFSDPEWQRLMTSLPDYYAYRRFAIGEVLGTVCFRNNECPLPQTVSNTAAGASSGFLAANTVVSGVAYGADPFAGELYSTGLTSGVPVHRVLFAGQGACNEYYQDLNPLITAAGITGKVGEPRITNNGIEVATDKITLILRAPLNVMQDMVSAAWKFGGTWVVRTDVCTGGAARYKRVGIIQHGE